MDGTQLEKNMLLIRVLQKMQYPESQIQSILQGLQTMAFVSHIRELHHWLFLPYVTKKDIGYIAFKHLRKSGVHMIVLWHDAAWHVYTGDNWQQFKADVQKIKCLVTYSNVPFEHTKDVKCFLPGMDTWSGLFVDLRNIVLQCRRNNVFFSKTQDTNLISIKTLFHIQTMNFASVPELPDFTYAILWRKYHNIQGPRKQVYLDAFIAYHCHEIETIPYLIPYLYHLNITRFVSSEHGCIFVDPPVPYPQPTYSMEPLSKMLAQMVKRKIYFLSKRQGILNKRKRTLSEEPC